jgi:trehalose synthase
MLRSEAKTLVPALRGRKVWMINSTAQGGGVAEMLPKMVSLLRELGVDIEWAVLETDRAPFFELTKRMHNMIHGVGNGTLSGEDRALFERVSQENADDLSRHVSAEDIVVVHDPQPLAMGAILKSKLGVKTVWRCHIGLAERLPVTRAIWRFLEPHASRYDQSVFSAPEYVPSYLNGEASIIHPAIDPLSHKNRDLHTHGLVGILCNGGLAVEYSPVLTTPFRHPARQLMPDGSWQPPCTNGDIGLLTRPILAQISRWDRLKGWSPLLDAFVTLKQRSREGLSEEHRRRLELLRLVLVGPDPASVADDPEGLEVIRELSQKYLELDPQLQPDVVLLTLPMESRGENAYMVNALQRCATVVIQNSIQEGFGLTATEAMWKRAPVLGTRACGLRQQIRDRIDGRLVDDPNDSDGIARTLDEMLADRFQRDRLGRAGQRRVYREFLIFTQLRRWLRVLAAMATR